MTRRRFLKVATMLVGGVVLPVLGPPVSAATLALDPQFRGAAQSSRLRLDLEEEHAIDIRLPIIAEDGANVPIVASLVNHPMEPDHYIESIQIINFNDPVVNKGVFRFTPANGQAYISTQIRMDGGDVEMFVIARCNQHGRWVASKTLKVSLGGC